MALIVPDVPTWVGLWPMAQSDEVGLLDGMGVSDSVGRPRQNHMVVACCHGLERHQAGLIVSVPRLDDEMGHAAGVPGR